MKSAVSNNFSAKFPITERSKGYQKTCTQVYRYRFNGKESDYEISGDGNALDFGARIYDSRLGRMMTLDPFFKKFSYESNYNVSGNNPICLLDENGNKKVYYIIIINEDGSRQSFKVVDTKFIKAIPVTITEKVCNPGDCEPREVKKTETEYHDVFQNIIINNQTGKTTFGEEQIGAKRSSDEMTRWVEDNLTDTEVKGSYGGIGWFSSSGRSQETKGGDGKNPIDNIDALVSLLSLTKGASAGDAQNLTKMVKSVKDFAEKLAASQAVVETSGVIKEQYEKVVSQIPKNKFICSHCKDTITDLGKPLHPIGKEKGFIKIK